MPPRPLEPPRYIQTAHVRRWPSVFLSSPELVVKMDVSGRRAHVTATYQARTLGDTDDSTAGWAASVVVEAPDQLSKM